MCALDCSLLPDQAQVQADDVAFAMPAAAGEPALWQAWRAHRDPEAREELVHLHLPYARIVAATYYARRFSDDLEFDDYLQLATVGLIECIDRFDPAVGVQFRTFAARRMHGSIIDGVERATEKQQQIAARNRIEAQRRASIAGEHDDHAAIPAATPAARTTEQLLQYVAETGLAFALSWMLDGTGMIDMGPGAEPVANVPFYRSQELRELRARIIELVDALPPQERQVLRRHYFQHMRFDEIARSMQLSNGRISQIHKKALWRLRESLGSHGLCELVA